ncbi:MAG: 2Fe-2S iron-sulfur cluster-binding protein, partial [Betaproteobacteria bacterium]
MPTFFVNKERVDIASSVSTDTPLLWILRDGLNLTGTKYGCGMSLCGACTVYLDGLPVRSCQTPLSALKPGADITTIEGLVGEPGVPPIAPAVANAIA